MEEAYNTQVLPNGVRIVTEHVPSVRSASLGIWVGTGSRSEKPGLLGRVSVALMSEVDRDEAELAGADAVKSAVEGRTGYMVGFRAEREPEYKSETILIPLEQVANAEKTFPPEWITPGGVTDEFRRYCLPLIGEYDTRFVSLR